MKPGELADLLARKRTSRTVATPATQTVATPDGVVAAKILAAARKAGVIPLSKE